MQSGGQQSPKVLGRICPRSGLKTPIEESTRIREVNSCAQVSSEKDLFRTGEMAEQEIDVQLRDTRPTDSALRPGRNVSRRSWYAISLPRDPLVTNDLIGGRLP